MSRFIREFPTNKSEEEAKSVIDLYLGKKGYSLVEYGEGGEKTWQKGVGLAAAPKFVKVTVRPGIVRIEAWIKYSWQPGVYSGEIVPTGLLGFIPKRAVRKKVRRLEKQLAV